MMPWGDSNHTLFLAPQQLGFGISSGVEAAVHATRIYLHNLPSNKALIKVDFENAFNSVRRDKILCAVKKFISKLLPYVYSAYSTKSVMLWDKVEITSSDALVFFRAKIRASGQNVGKVFNPVVKLVLENQPFLMPEPAEKPSLHLLWRLAVPSVQSPGIF